MFFEGPTLNAAYFLCFLRFLRFLRFFPHPYDHTQSILRKEAAPNRRGSQKGSNADEKRYRGCVGFWSLKMKLGGNKCMLRYLNYILRQVLSPFSKNERNLQHTCLQH